VARYDTTHVPERRPRALHRRLVKRLRYHRTQRRKHHGKYRRLFERAFADADGRRFDHQNGEDAARFDARIVPRMARAALYQRVAAFEAHDLAGVGGRPAF
jgi:hypothetical protein